MPAHLANIADTNKAIKQIRIAMYYRFGCVLKNQRASLEAPIKQEKTNIANKKISWIQNVPDRSPLWAVVIIDKEPKQRYR
jgi:hypothetical protein